MAAYPVILRAPDGSSVRIDRFPVVLGRSQPGEAAQPDCDLSAFDRDQLVAPRHAVIDWRGGRLYVIDLGAPAGTQLNGRPVGAEQTAEIGPRGVVTLGTLPISAEIDAAAGPIADVAPPPAAVTPPPAPPSAEPAPQPAPEVIPAPLPGAPSGAAAPPSAPPPPPAPARPGDVAALLMRALGDPEVSELRLAADRAPLVCHRGTWQQVGDGPLGARGWAAFWQAFSERTGADRNAQGRWSGLVDDAVAVEAVLPPLAVEPSLRSRRLAPALSLDALEERGLVDAATAAGLREAVAAGAGIVVVGAAAEAVSAVVEAVAAALPSAATVVVVEASAGLRVGHASAVRLRAFPATPGGEAAYELGASLAADWVVIDGALPEAAAAAAWRGGVGGPAVLLGARTADAAAWRERAALALAARAQGLDAARTLLAAALPTALVVELGADGQPHVATLERS